MSTVMLKYIFFLSLGSLIKNRGEIRQIWQETAVKQMNCFVLSVSTWGRSFTKLDNWITTLYYQQLPDWYITLV